MEPRPEVVDFQTDDYRDPDENDALCDHIRKFPGEIFCVIKEDKRLPPWGVMVVGTKIWAGPEAYAKGNASKHAIHPEKLN